MDFNDTPAEARFREEALDPALSSLGRIALAVADGLNQQQKLGIDLEGELGNAIFTDINAPALVADRVRGDSANRLPNDRVLSVHIDDVGALTTSDYELKFEGLGSQYSIIRESDGKLMAEGVLGNKLPLDISMDGFTLTLESGSFQSGDKFTILPTKTGVSEIDVLITRPEEFAFASPIRTQAGAGNSGGAYILPGDVIDINTPTFTSAPGNDSFHNGDHLRCARLFGPSEPYSAEPAAFKPSVLPWCGEYDFPERPWWYGRCQRR